MNNADSKNDFDQSRQAKARSELDAKMDEFRSKGGAVTRCAPGPSAAIIYTKYSRSPQKGQAGQRTAPVVPSEGEGEGKASET